MCRAGHPKKSGIVAKACLLCSLRCVLFFTPGTWGDSGQIKIARFNSLAQTIKHTTGDVTYGVLLRETSRARRRFSQSVLTQAWQWTRTQILHKTGRKGVPFFRDM